MTNIKKIVSSLTPLLGNFISNVVLDNRKIDSIPDTSTKGEQCVVYFGNTCLLKVSSDDEHPHFYGESNIELTIDSYPNGDISPQMNFRVEKIKFWYWKERGISLGFGHYLNASQIEFFDSSGRVLSIGLFTNGDVETKFSYTGEVFVNFFGLTNEGVEKNLMFNEITMDTG